MSAVGEDEGALVDGEAAGGLAVAPGGERAAARGLAVPLVAQVLDELGDRVAAAGAEERRAGVEARRLAVGQVVELACQAPERPEDEEPGGREDHGPITQNTSRFVPHLFTK